MIVGTLRSAEYTCIIHSEDLSSSSSLMWFSLKHYNQILCTRRDWDIIRGQSFDLTAMLLIL